MYNKKRLVTNEYQRQKIMTASHGELTLMLYNGCIKDIKLAMEYIKQKQYENANNMIKKAQDIITELLATLDMSYEISEDISKLYYFIYDTLMDANIKKDNHLLADVLKIVEEFRDTWFQVLKSSNNNEAKKNAI